jgi:hypothetical protein
MDLFHTVVVFGVITGNALLVYIARKVEEISETLSERFNPRHQDE